MVSAADATGVACRAPAAGVRLAHGLPPHQLHRRRVGSRRVVERVEPPDRLGQLRVEIAGHGRRVLDDVVPEAAEPVWRGLGSSGGIAPLRGSFAGAEQRAQPAHRAKLDAVDGGPAATQDGADLVAGQPGQAPLDDLALVGRELPEEVPYPPPLFRGERQLLRRGGGVDQVHRRVQRRVRRPGAVGVDQDVVGDGERPGAERRFPAAGKGCQRLRRPGSSRPPPIPGCRDGGSRSGRPHRRSAGRAGRTPGSRASPAPPARHRRLAPRSRDRSTAARRRSRPASSVSTRRRYTSIQVDRNRPIFLRVDESCPRSGSLANAFGVRDRAGRHRDRRARARTGTRSPVATDRKTGQILTVTRVGRRSESRSRSDGP